MKRKVILAAFLIVKSLMPVRAESLPIGEPTRTHFISAALKICLAEMNGNPNYQKAWSQTEIKDYCSCNAVTLADRTTKSDRDAYEKTGKYPAEYTATKQDVVRYCSNKYLQMPDVSDIKNKKW